MMVVRIKCTNFFFLIIAVLASCKSKDSVSTEVEALAGTPVTVTSVTKNVLSETIELNATSSFLLKSPVKALANGYLQNIKIRQGDFVRKGEVLMSMITKEVQSIGSDINKLDSSFHFKGAISIVAPGSGYISQLNYQSGDYVQDGEQIATISDEKSFAFILELPYELTPLVVGNKKIKLQLPDSSILDGTIEKPLPTVDAASQTQSYVISVNSQKMIPENLVAKAVLIKSIKPNAITVPKEAVLTDETQGLFWVMKLLNDTIAVKIVIQKGIEAGNKVEIVSPKFSETDRILISGNYGLPDTALVLIKK